jgi:hypothetical protein
LDGDNDPPVLVGDQAFWAVERIRDGQTVRNMVSPDRGSRRGEGEPGEVRIAAQRQ